MRVSSYVEALVEEGVEAACLTNHGDMRDFDHLKRIAPAGLLLIPGVEISSEEGDFILFSTDYEFLDSLLVMQELPERNERPAETAAVWAHPFAGMGHDSYDESYIAGVANRIDGIEVFNGNWLDAQGIELARKVAGKYTLAELGGSDSHRRENLLRCWTEVKELDTPLDFITAIKEQNTRAISPEYDR
jgi:hypothetical protein